MTRFGAPFSTHARLARVLLLWLATGSASLEAQTTEPVEWTNLVGVVPYGTNQNNLSKVVLGSGNAGAVSTKAISSGDGYVEFSGGSAYRVLGLGNGDSGQTVGDIQYAIYLDNATVIVYES